MSHPRLVVAAVTSLVLGSVVLLSPGAATGAPPAPRAVQAQKFSVHKVRTATLGPGQKVAAPGSGELRPDGEAGDPPKAVRNRSPRSRARHATTTPLSGIPATQTLTVDEPANSGWRALNHYEQRYADGGNQYSLIPPDQALCAGNGQVFEGVNNAFQVYDTSGHALLPAVVSANQFLWGDSEYNRTTFESSPHQVGDPSCVYDAGSNRFFLTTYDLVGDKAGNLSGASSVDIAVSPAGTALGKWSVYQFDTTDGDGDGCPCFGDYPHLGTDANGLYITTNEFSTLGSAYNGAQVYAIDKAALVAGNAAIPGAHFDTSDQDLLKDGTTIAGYSLAPAVSAGANYALNAMYFLSSDADAGDVSVTSSQILQWKIDHTSALTNSPGSLSLTHTTVPVDPYAIAPLAEQKAGPTPLADCLNLTACAKLLLGRPDKFKEYEYALDSNDSRMLQSAYADGKLWGALDTIVDVDGAARAGIAYYVVDPATSTIEKQGTLAVSDQNITYPALGVTAAGKAAMTFTLVGKGYYPSAAYATFDAVPTTEVSNVQVPGLGQGPDDSFGGYRGYQYNHARWGDYGAASVVDGQVYLASEYIAQSCTLARYRTAPFGTCDGTRTALANWATHIVAVTP